MDNGELEKLLTLCSSNDVDTKISGVTKLQIALESGIEITDKDSIINSLKSCLRASNQLLTNATLATIPPILPLLITLNPAQAPATNPGPSLFSSTSSSSVSSSVDTYTLRQAIQAFLPAGGIIDRLGDSRDKAREKARESLVVLGGLAFRGSSALLSSKSKDGKGPETPLMLFEKFLREGGLSSKVWRVREQSILTLVHLRRVYHLFPIRPYLPFLVAALEDGDAHVRECARDSVVELFSGPGVTDTARADLKAVMIKKNVRKGIVESILSKLVPGSKAIHPQSEGSENGDGEKIEEYFPPSLALQGRKPTADPTVPSGGPHLENHTNARPQSRAGAAPISEAAGTTVADVRAIYIASSRDMENEFSSMAKAFEGKETEHNWSTRDQAILRVRGMLKGDVHLRYIDAFLACLKDGFMQWSLKALASLRTTVAANTCALYTELAATLGSVFDPFCENVLAHLLKMAGYTKKITAQQSQNSVAAIITHCSAQPRVVLPLLWHAIQEKIVQARAFAVTHIKLFLEVHSQRSKHIIEISNGLELLEKSIKRSLGDANPAVRENARTCFWVFEAVWRDKGRVILESLDSTSRKQLEKACPDSNATAVVSPVQSPSSKKSSVAAAIAASRAKAKTIAAAPPTLRHQATSTSHYARATSPPPRQSTPSSTSLKSSTGQRPTSPLSRTSSSPPANPPRSRILSNPIPRANTSNATAKARSPPGSVKSFSPPSSPYSSPVVLRRTASPLSPTSNSNGSFRVALQTALPASPPHAPLVQETVPEQQNALLPAVSLAPRPSVVLFEQTGEEDLLMASSIPVPEDSDSGSEDPVNLMSFSGLFEAAQKTPAPRSNSQAQSFSPKSAFDDLHSNNTAFSNSTPGPPPIVEDAMRARAEQAESAAERLLELVDPEEEGHHHSPIPTSLLVGSSTLASKPKPKLKPKSINAVRAKAAPVPVTPPNNKNATILKQAAMFKDSPIANGRSSSLLDVLKNRKHETGWWLKRMNLIRQKAPLTEKKSEPQELLACISALENGEATTKTLRTLAMLCIGNPVVDPASSPMSAGFTVPPSPSPFSMSSHALPALQNDIWTENKNFNRMFKGLIKFLDPFSDEDVLEHGLIVLWEILHNQSAHVEGREADVFLLLLRIRYCNKANVLEATNTIRDSMTNRIEPVYGLTTMHASLRGFQSEPLPPKSTAEVKASTYAFGLNALGKFILQLPAEVLEDELPRLRETLTSALNDKSSLVVRESAAASIIAAQLVLQDETHLFTLLDGLTDEKKNLLTYFFDKHAVRGTVAGRTGAKSGMERLSKEMSRLDTWTSTPPRSVAA